MSDPRRSRRGVGSHIAGRRCTGCERPHSAPAGRRAVADFHIPLIRGAACQSAPNHAGLVPGSHSVLSADNRPAIILHVIIEVETAVRRRVTWRGENRIVVTIRILRVGRGERPNIHFVLRGGKSQPPEIAASAIGIALVIGDHAVHPVAGKAVQPSAFPRTGPMPAQGEVQIRVATQRIVNGLALRAKRRRIDQRRPVALIAPVRRIENVMADHDRAPIAVGLQEIVRPVQNRLIGNRVYSNEITIQSMPPALNNW